jgi:hypothetical protein
MSITHPQQSVVTGAAHGASPPPPAFGYPSNSVVGVVNTPGALRALRGRLAAAGVAPERIETLRGAAASERLDSPPAGLLGIPRRWLGGLGPEAELLRDDARELRAGHTLVVVHGVRRADAEQLRDLLAAHGGHAVRHFGRLTVALLTP